MTTCEIDNAETRVAEEDAVGGVRARLVGSAMRESAEGIVQPGRFRRRRTTRRDLQILLATVRTVVLQQPVAVNRTTGELTLRRR